MTGIATIACLALALVTVCLSGWKALRDRAASTPEVLAAGVLEVGVLFYVVVRTVDLIGGHRPSGTGLVIAYLIGIVLVMPVAVVLGLAESTRWGAVVIVAGALVVCVLLARVDQVWTMHG